MSAEKFGEGFDQSMVALRKNRFSGRMFTLGPKLDLDTPNPAPVNN